MLLFHKFAGQICFFNVLFRAVKNAKENYIKICFHHYLFMTAKLLNALQIVTTNSLHLEFKLVFVNILKVDKTLSFKARAPTNFVRTLTTDGPRVTSCLHTGVFELRLFTILELRTLFVCYQIFFFKWQT